MLAENYGWSIEYIFNLTYPQIRMLFDAASELNKEVSEKNKKISSNSTGYKVGNKQIEKYEVNSTQDFLGLIGMGNSGFKISDKLKKKQKRK